MPFISAAVSFLFVGAGVFLLAGLFILPHVPPYPCPPVSCLEGRYWYDNWPGYVLGLGLGVFVAWRTLKYHERKAG